MFWLYLFVEELGKYKYIIYIVIGILYLIFKGKGKKADQTNTNPLPPINTDKTPSKNFESKSNIPGKTRLLKSQPVRKSEDSRNNLSKESQEITNPKVVDYEDELNKRNLGEKETSKMDENSGKSFEPYSQEKNTQNPYAEMLKDPESIKKVFIAQEIFKPKSF